MGFRYAGRPHDNEGWLTEGQGIQPGYLGRRYKKCVNAIDFQPYTYPGNITSKSKYPFALSIGGLWLVKNENPLQERTLLIARGNEDLSSRLPRSFS
jgi:hypothetical protein